MQYDESTFLECLKRIEAKLGWGESKAWTNADFEKLSEKILSETGVNLSTSTLKRLWGKVKYESVPQAATLNALSRFAGFESYRDFANACKPKNSLESVAREELAAPEHILLADDEIPEKIIARKRPLSSSTIWSIGLFMGISLSLLLAFSLSVEQKNDGQVNPALYSFNSRPVSDGIPNSVVFTFDAGAAKTDCVYIQQSWDPKLRFKVNKDQKRATSIYYHPGFFKAKLLVNNQVVKEHDLLIKTKGWLPIVEQEPVPVYFTKEESIHEGMLSLSAEQLAQSNIPLQPLVPWVRYYYVQDLGNLPSGSFSLETGLKNTYMKGSGACGHTMLIVICEKNSFVVPLSIAGCTSSLHAYFSGKQLPGTQTDLSALGVDFTKWVKLRLEVKNKTVQILINDKPALQSNYLLDAGKVIGFAYRFQGIGAVDYLHVFDENGKEVLKEDFQEGI